VEVNISAVVDILVVDMRVYVVQCSEYGEIEILKLFKKEKRAKLMVKILERLKYNSSLNTERYFYKEFEVK